MTIKSITSALAAVAIAITTLEPVFVVGAYANDKIQQQSEIPEAKTVADGSILVVPFTTELQRLASPSFAGADFLIEVNGRELFGDNAKPTRREADEFDYGQFADEFKAIEGFKDAKVTVRVLWPASDVESSIAGQVCQARLWLVLKPLCREAIRSSHQVVFPENLDKATWQIEVAMLARKPTREEIRGERSTGDNRVGVYKPQTPLSRFLYQECDCVVHLIPPVLEAELSAVKSMEQGVSKLDLKKKSRVSFLYTPGRQPVEENVLLEEFFGAHVWRDRLGFSDWCRISRY